MVKIKKNSISELPITEKTDETNETGLNPKLCREYQEWLNQVKQEKAHRAIEEYLCDKIKKFENRDKLSFVVK